MTRKLLPAMSAGLLLTLSACAGVPVAQKSANLPDLPDFLNPDDIQNASFVCADPDENTYTAEEQKQIDILWDQSLKYISATAKALTTPGDSSCINSDSAIIETADGLRRMCITDQDDVRRMVTSIYQVMYNQDEAKKCFSPRLGGDNLYGPRGALYENSSVAKWINRPSLGSFFESSTVQDPEVKAYGQLFAENFSDMVTGDEIKMPDAFPYDISANSLPDLWAAVGWFPMYAETTERNVRNQDATRGGYAYGEIFGPWGLLRVETINGEPVGTELGMVAQADGTYYSFHNHAISELYYTMRKPYCDSQFESFAIRETNPAVEATLIQPDKRTVTVNTSTANGGMQWGSGSWEQDDLVYFHQNTIHAFDARGEGCEADPEDKAWITVWARTNAANKHNDYGNTVLCADNNDTTKPPVRGKVIQCWLTNIQW